MLRISTSVPSASRPVGDVELPAFVGLFGLEADVAAFGAFVRLGGDKASCRQDPPDRRYRGADTVALLEVKRDRGCTGLMSIAVEFLAQLDDLIFEVFGGTPGAVLAVSVSGLQTGLALGEVALNEGDHPPSRNPVLAGNLTFTTPFDQHGRDHQLRHSHRSTLVVGCERCPETGVNDLVNSRTPPPPPVQGPKTALPPKPHYCCSHGITHLGGQLRAKCGHGNTIASTRLVCIPACPASDGVGVIRAPHLTPLWFNPRRIGSRGGSGQPVLRPLRLSCRIARGSSTPHRLHTELHRASRRAEWERLASAISRT